MKVKNFIAGIPENQTTYWTAAIYCQFTFSYMDIVFLFKAIILFQKRVVIVIEI